MEIIPDPHTSPSELTVDTVRAWMLELTEGERRLGARFARWDVRRRAGAYLQGWLSPGERKNGWPLAAVHGAATPYGVQHRLGRARWDAEAVRADWRCAVFEPRRVPPGLLVIAEPGFRQKGRHAAGVARP
jgi:SRSO17 transposase